MKKLNELEYSVVMQALKDAQVAHLDDEFVDPYAGDDFDYTFGEIKEALEQAELILRAQYLADKEPIDTAPSIITSRADIDHLGYDSSKLSDASFAYIANKAGEFCMENWWNALDDLCKSHRLIKNEAKRII